jgi:hypothetical protein
MMSQLYDPQMARLADFDCFSQVVFKKLEHYKTFKQDPEYKRRLMGDHEKFADTKKSMLVLLLQFSLLHTHIALRADANVSPFATDNRMTIGWVEQFIDGNIIVEGLDDPAKSTAGLQTTALVAGSFLSGKRPSRAGLIGSHV